MRSRYPGSGCWYLCHREVSILGQLRSSLDRKTFLLFRLVFGPQCCIHIDRAAGALPASLALAHSCLTNPTDTNAAVPTRLHRSAHALASSAKTPRIQDGTAANSMFSTLHCLALAMATASSGTHQSELLVLFCDLAACTPNSYASRFPGGLQAGKDRNVGSGDV